MPRKFYYNKKNKNKKKLKVSKAVRSFVKKTISENIENKFGYKKFPDPDDAKCVLNSTPRFDLLNGLSKGSARNQRVGNRIKNKYLDISFYLKAPADTITTYRLILLKQTQPQTLGPTTNELFTSTANWHLAPFDLNYVGVGKNLSIIWDHRITTSQVTDGAICFKKRWRMNTYTQYNDGDTGTILDINTCAYYLFAVTDQGANSDYFAVMQHSWEDA